MEAGTGRSDRLTMWRDRWGAPPRTQYTSETKPFFLTSEFLVYVRFIMGLAVTCSPHRRYGPGRDRSSLQTGRFYPPRWHRGRHRASAYDRFSSVSTPASTAGASSAGKPTIQAPPFAAMSSAQAGSL